VAAETAIEVRQYVKSNRHYRLYNLVFTAVGGVAAVTRKNFFTSPAYTNGVDILLAAFRVLAVHVGDRILAAKALIGQVGTVIAADSGAKTVTVRSTKGVLAGTVKGGVIDEGHQVSFGAETFSESSPLDEFEIKRIGDPTPVTATVEDVVLTLFTFPASMPTPGQACNLAVNFVGSPLKLTDMETLELGRETIGGSNLPAGRVMQLTWERNNVADAEVNVRLAIIY
jgi:hypothetical protein